VLDGDELRLRLGEMGKDRPAAFPEKRKPGEVLILRRETFGATPPKAKDAQPVHKVLTPEEAIKQMSKEKVTGQFKVNAAEVIRISNSNVIYENAGSREGLILRDSDSFASEYSFAVQLLPPVMETIRRLGIEPDKHFRGKAVRVTGVVQTGQT